jgi:hypothetical protein
MPTLHCIRLALRIPCPPNAKLNAILKFEEKHLPQKSQALRAFLRTCLFHCSEPILSLFRCLSHSQFETAFRHILVRHALL